MNIPNEPHYAIIKERTIYHEADERSKTNPGHGYPAWNETVVEYIPFTNQSAWEQSVLDRTSRREVFKAVYVTPAKIETKITVKID